MKVESIGGGAGRQASGLPAQGYSKYQKSLPPRFQRQQQVRRKFSFQLVAWQFSCLLLVISHPPPFPSLASLSHCEHSLVFFFLDV